MRRIVLATAVIGAFAVVGTPAHAYRVYPWYPWCAWLADTQSQSCAFSTLQQCLATISGVGGYCGINPYPPPPAVAQWRPKRRYAR